MNKKRLKLTSGTYGIVLSMGTSHQEYRVEYRRDCSKKVKQEAKEGACEGPT